MRTSDGLPGQRLDSSSSRPGMMSGRVRRAALTVVLVAGCVSGGEAGFAASKDAQAAADWPVYGGSVLNDRYSTLHQINRGNVKDLKVAWTYDTRQTGGLQTNPLIIGNILYGYTPTQQVIALDAASGRKLWEFNPGTPGLQPARGLSFWPDPTGGNASILFAGMLTNLYALDPKTGKPIATFGDGGSIDLRKDLDEPDISQSFAAPTTPGLIYKDTIIVGSRLPES